MALIKGITVELINREETGKDAFNHPIYTETVTEIKNILVAPASTTEIADTLNLYGKKAMYSIAIPKGDTHIWKDQKVKFFGETWLVIGFSQRGIEENIPLAWNEKWMVAKYE